jgi:hypothetical protein
MLIQTQYNNLWTINLGLPLQNIPCFYKYLQREVYFQDYLDLFGCQKNGRPTFERLEVQGHQTVSIQGLRADPNNVYTALDENGEVRLIVDYDYPFDRNELCKDREIKYLLIGEAAPTSGSYIYKDAKGSYITAPLTAIGMNVTRLNRTQRLLEFANNGFLLLDFFPFAINFTSPGIVLNNMIIGFFIHLMNLKINSLTSLNKATWDFCFIGPKRTSLPILNWLDTFYGNTFNGKPTLHQLDLNGANFIDNGDNVHSDYTNNLNILAWPISHLSKRAKFTVAIGGSGPNSHLIRRVFYLP